MLPKISLIDAECAKFLLFSSNDEISKKLFQDGAWESHLLAISKFFCDAVDAPFVIDVGANLGAYSIPLALYTQNRNGSVVAFEPQRIIYYQLCGNIFLNRLENIIAINKAVSHEAGVIDIPEIDYMRNHNVGAFSIEKDYRIAHNIEFCVKNNTYPVEAINLNGFDVDRSPALLKIDVEGHELNVLKGALEFLERHSFPPILFEAWEFEWFAEGRKELFSFLQHIGFDIFRIDPTNYIAQHPKNAVYVDFQFSNGTILMTRVK